MEGSQNFKSRSREPFSTPFDLILHIFRQYPWCSIRMRILNFVAPTVPEIWRSPKSRSREPLPIPFDLILHFSFVPLTVNLYAQFEVSSSNRFRDMEEVPKFQK